MKFTTKRLVRSVQSDKQLLKDDSKTWFDEKKFDFNKHNSYGMHTYYRHLERHSKSLDSNKYLHHKIFLSTSSESKNNKKVPKVSKKEQEIINITRNGGKRWK
jgi:hypothetical protein